MVDKCYNGALSFVKRGNNERQNMTDHDCAVCGSVSASYCEEHGHRWQTKPAVETLLAAAGRCTKCGIGRDRMFPYCHYDCEGRKDAK